MLRFNMPMNDEEMLKFWSEELERALELKAGIEESITMAENDIEAMEKGWYPKEKQYIQGKGWCYYDEDGGWYSKEGLSKAIKDERKRLKHTLSYIATCQTELAKYK